MPAQSATHATTEQQLQEDPRLRRCLALLALRRMHSLYTAGPHSEQCGRPSKAVAQIWVATLARKASQYMAKAHGPLLRNPQRQYRENPKGRDVAHRGLNLVQIDVLC